ncbi:MAG: response regulator, partial [Janthinobacterium sp.]
DADGVDLLTQIRAHTSPGTARLPALALTAFAQAQDRQRALASGFQAWVAKPLDPAELVAAVAQLAATRVTATPLKR